MKGQLARAIPIIGHGHRRSDPKVRRPPLGLGPEGLGIEVERQPSPQRSKHTQNQERMAIAQT